MGWGVLGGGVGAGVGGWLPHPPATPPILSHVQRTPPQHTHTMIDLRACPLTPSPPPPLFPPGARTCCRSCVSMRTALPPCWRDGIRCVWSEGRGVGGVIRGLVGGVAAEGCILRGVEGAEGEGGRMK